MNFDLKEFISSSMILFAIIDVVGNIPLIVLLREKYKVIESEKASLVSLIIMIVFLFLGEIILNLLGVDINSFAVAGSIIILFLAAEMILGVRLYKDSNPKTASIVPLAFPLIAGPGTLTTLISIKSEYNDINIHDHTAYTTHFFKITQPALPFDTYFVTAHTQPPPPNLSFVSHSSARYSPPIFFETDRSLVSLAF